MIRAAHPVLRVGAIGALLFALGLTLSACGRKGPLDPPPASSVVEQPSQLETDSQGKDIAPPGQKKRIFIDKILD